MAKVPFFLLSIYLGLLFFEPQQFIPILGKIRITYLFALLTLVAAFFFAPKENKSNLFKNKIFWGVILIFILINLSLINNNITFSSNVEYQEVIKTLALFLMVILIIGNKEEFNKFFILLLSFGAINALVSIYYYTRGYLPTRMISYFGNLGQSGSNEFALMLVMLLPIPLVLLKRQNTKLKQVALIFSILIFMYCITRTRSRSGFLGVAIVLLVLLFLRYFSVKEILIGILFLILIYMKTPGSYFGRMGTITEQQTMSEDRNVSSRIETYIIAWDIIKKNPFFGIGLGNYLPHVKFYYYTYAGDKIYVIHNAFLKLTAETGVLTLFLFLVLLTYILRKGLKFGKFSQNSIKEFILSDAIIASISGYIVIAMFQPVPFDRLLYMNFALIGWLINYTELPHDFRQSDV
jgi:O-antigen ligase